MGAINKPVMPNKDSITRSASKSSQAAALILVPTIFALMKYSSLCIPTKNTKAAIATFNDTPSAHPDSAGSQYFICLGDAPHLDGNYTAFGKVTKGLEVVDRIAAVQTGPGDRPVGTLPTMSKVTA